MPQRAPKPCGRMGCPAVIPARERYCKEHKTQPYRRTTTVRGSRHQRGYDADWIRLRAWQLREHPFCQCDDCQDGAKRLRIANVVDHIKTIAEHPELRLDPTNLRSMHKRCHDRHTARTVGGWLRRG